MIEQYCNRWLNIFMEGLFLTLCCFPIYFFYLKNCQVQESSDKGLSWHVRSRVNVQGRGKRLYSCVLMSSHQCWKRFLNKRSLAVLLLLLSHSFCKEEWVSSHDFSRFCACASFWVELNTPQDVSSNPLPSGMEHNV